MRLLVIGCNHRTASVEVRERIAFDESAIARALDDFRASFPEAESVLLSTCNRMELYIARLEGARPRITDAIGFIARRHRIEPGVFSAGLYRHENDDVARHLFRVVSSLDSMVMGETQILGQAKAAFEAARSAGTARRVLVDLFSRAFRVAKTVQTTTEITAGRVSIGSAAVDLARQIFSHFNDKTVMIVGAGKMGELTLRHLLAIQPQRLLVTNRTDARAADLSERLRAAHTIEVEVVPFSAWHERLAEADILISSTGAREPILTARDFAPVPRRRDYRPILLIDIAVPRDIDAAVAENEGAFLYNIDDLQAVTEATRVQRTEAVGRCEQIIAQAVEDYQHSRTRQELGPLVAALRERFRSVGDDEFSRVLPKLSAASQRDRELIEQMIHRILQKLLHHPVHRLNDRGDNGAVQAYADALRDLFKLGAPEPPDQNTVEPPPEPMRERRTDDRNEPD